MSVPALSGVYDSDITQIYVSDGQQICHHPIHYHWVRNAVCVSLKHL